ncbi:MAG: hypothetical protein WBE48_07400 [Xanthobacteraceae bacterium]
MTLSVQVHPLLTRHRFITGATGCQLPEKSAASVCQDDVACFARLGLPNRVDALAAMSETAHLVQMFDSTVLPPG